MHIGEVQVKLKRYEGNPILSPNQAAWYDKLASGQMHITEEEQ